MKKKEPKRQSVYSSWISPDDCEYLKLENELEQLEKELQSRLRKEDQVWLYQYQQAQENMTLYLIAKGIEIGLQGGTTILESNAIEAKRLLQ